MKDKLEGNTAQGRARRLQGAAVLSRLQRPRQHDEPRKRWQYRGRKTNLRREWIPPRSTGDSNTNNIVDIRYLNIQ
jgi:hypothetical protein